MRAAHVKEFQDAMSLLVPEKRRKYSRYNNVMTGLSKLQLSFEEIGILDVDDILEYDIVGLLVHFLLHSNRGR